MSAAELRKAAETLRRAKADFNAALLRWQSECSHKGTIVEAGFRSGIIFDSLPQRACERCGVWEEGWSPKILPGRAYPTRDAVPTRISPESEWVHPTIARLINGGAA